ncbi:conserved hypothetical protein [Segniliparus rotundus DSM 44985]|uniref:DUF1345 domain-containing protein n=1 Tax=Segniliparus rotundus (strain ATCC BAA-972 / CDC 1076 / CIP 108378 / DSM 44985 / JCM 13578) TaxID=640132 RepID=D6ZBU5_SEGRD|nr:hypothetical protein [Segniliparus rotundus]ADG96922.1 conserved hypothetical protein [Segniliparus rotundus DSM 44985]
MSTADEEPGQRRPPHGARKAAGSTAHLAAELEEHTPSWLRPHNPENRLPVLAAMLVAVALQLAVADSYALHPRWLLFGLESVLLVVLIVLNPIRLTRHPKLSRAFSIALVAGISVDNAVSSALLDENILTGRTGKDAVSLLGSGAAVYVTNIIAYGIWYWLLDRGGPFARHEGRHPNPSFLFPQMTLGRLAPKNWVPRFFDYFYVSFTNATAFSPTDTMPLTHWAKALMAAQSMVALATMALVVARAVNVLG